MNKNTSSDVVPVGSRTNTWISGIAWLIALGLVAFAGYLGWTKWQNQTLAFQPVPTPVDIAPTATTIQHQSNYQIDELPSFDPSSRTKAKSVYRLASLFTNIPNRPRRDVIDYTVTLGDSVFSIAQVHNLQPETILWSNYEVLKDNPHSLSTEMILNIPPVDGVYYQWREDDTLNSVAGAFKTTADEILNWPGNRLDLTNPEIEPDAWIMIPGGQRDFQQWIVPVMPRGAAGVSSGIYGGGACPGGYDGLYGSGAFIWPASNRTISGNDYWSGHLAIDIGSALGEPIRAADAGVIVFAGWATGGYGNTVAIDHGNGYQTLYAHLNSVSIRCGQSVVQGQTIGFGGSTGNSTGPHLHFEVRYQGGFVNPWYVLPAP